jgi:hypothetical protein
MTAGLSIGDQIVIDVIDVVAAERESETLCCGFCGREQADVLTLLTGSTGQICNFCVTAFSEAVSQGRPLPIGASFRDESELSCGFCGKGTAITRSVIVRNGAAVCPECLRTASDIQAEARHTTPGET